jgi:hypothetical protein
MAVSSEISNHRSFAGIAKTPDSSASPRFWTDVKVKQAWLGALACLTAAAAIAFTVLSFTASPWFFAAAIPLYLASGAILSYAARMTDYENPQQLARVREEAAKMPLLQVAEKHGWDNIFRYEILTPAQFETAYRAEVSGKSLNLLIDTYRFVQGKIQNDAFQIPPPSEWKSKLAEETGGMNFQRLIFGYSLTDLIQYNLIAPEKFVESFNDFAAHSSVYEIIRAHEKAKSQIGSAMNGFNPQFIGQFSIEMPDLRAKFSNEWGHAKPSEVALAFQKNLGSLREHQIVAKDYFELLVNARAEFDAADREINQAKKSSARHIESYVLIRNQAKEIADRAYHSYSAHAQLRSLNEMERGEKSRIEQWFRTEQRIHPEKTIELHAEKERRLSETSREYRLARVPYESQLDTARQIRDQSYRLADDAFAIAKERLKAELDRAVEQIKNLRDQRLALIDGKARA